MSLVSGSGDDDEEEEDEGEGEDDEEEDEYDEEKDKSTEKKRKSKKKILDDEKEKENAEKELLEKKAESDKELTLAKYNIISLLVFLYRCLLSLFSFFRTEQDQIRDKLQSLENKILVGGENLLEKANAQEKLLEDSIEQLELAAKAERELKESLQKKEAERIDIEERYSSLQEECVGKTKKLHRVMQMLMSVKGELADQQQEQQREKEGIYDNIRSLSRELALCELVLHSYIPKEYQNMIEQFTQWNEDIGEWQLRCVAYTGNNMRKNIPETKAPSKDPDFIDLSHVYLSYNTDTLAEPIRAKSARPRTSGVPRPTTSKKRYS